MPKRRSDTSGMRKANSGKKKYYCSWKPKWFLKEVNQGLVGLKNDSQRVECTYCCTTFSVKYGGKNDVTSHIDLDSHKERVLAGKRTGRQARMAEYFNQSQETVADESGDTVLSAKENLAFILGASFTKLCVS